jgi:hypothetical protein
VMQMDELTQQNAALVEEATAASQAMAEQVRGLNQMLDRYRVGDLIQAAAPAPRAPAQAPARAERRSGQRPWSERSKSAPADTARKAPRANGALGVVAAPGVNGVESATPKSDSEWREF